MDIADLVESTGIFYGLVVEILSFYMTITTGYLIAAYLIGDKLNTMQVIVISVLYIGMACLSSYAAFAWITRAVHFAKMQADIDPDADIFPGQYVAVIVATFLFCGVFVCCKFMWDIRHPKTG